MTETTSTYASAFTWRYGSPEMREIWSVRSTRLWWRRIWVALAQAQQAYGLVNPAQLAELEENQDQIDLARSGAIEERIRHDLMAELKVFADQSPGAGGILHLGATSMDIKDNALVLQQKAALACLLERSRTLLMLLARVIDEQADLPVIGFTHLQPAEPTTLGYRLAQTGQDLLICHLDLESLQAEIKSKGFAGAVGSSASFAELIGKENLPAFQASLGQALGLDFFPVVSQTYPRLQDYRVLAALAGLAAVLYKFAFDLRILQSPGWGELAEAFREEQIGSSAMPFKRNPIQSEKINSLGRYLAQLPRVAWDNAAHSLLERTLDDSANRRIILPEAFLAADEILESSREILAGLQVNQARIARNLEDYGPFAATEKLLMVLVKAGADRQAMHARIREHCLAAWSALQEGTPNPLIDLLASDGELGRYLAGAEIKSCLAETSYLGDAADRAREMARRIKAKISS